MTIVKYNNKTYDPQQAIRDGWGIEIKDNYKPLAGMTLEDRKDPSHTATIKAVEYLRSYQMTVVRWEDGGWNSLDHAVEQFKPAGGTK